MSAPRLQAAPVGAATTNAFADTANTARRRTGRAARPALPSSRGRGVVGSHAPHLGARVPAAGPGSPRPPGPRTVRTRPPGAPGGTRRPGPPLPFRPVCPMVTSSSPGDGPSTAPARAPARASSTAEGDLRRGYRCRPTAPRTGAASVRHDVPGGPALRRTAAGPARQAPAPASPPWRPSRGHAGPPRPGPRRTPLTRPGRRLMPGPAATGHGPPHGLGVRAARWPPGPRRAAARRRPRRST